MRIDEITAQSEALDYNSLLEKYPEIEGDLNDVSIWMEKPAADLNYRLSVEKLTKFQTQIDQMVKFYEIPLLSAREKRQRNQDLARTRKIIKIIKNGGRQLPIFVDESNGFLMEGRHRLVAFHMLGLHTTPVVSVSA